MNKEMNEEKPVQLHRHEDSVLFGQKECRHAAVGFRDDPKRVVAITLAGLALINGIGRQDAPSRLQGLVVGLRVFFADTASVTAYMAVESAVKQ